MSNLKIAVAALVAPFLIQGCASQAQPAASGHVTIASGELAGTREDGVVSFRNIPFAAPPVGDLRWQPPAAPAAWEGVRDASEFGPSCPSRPGPTARKARPSPIRARTA